MSWSLHFRPGNIATKGYVMQHLEPLLQPNNWDYGRDAYNIDTSFFWSASEV
jgi:hypothetical protein